MDESQDWATVDPRKAKSIGRRGNMVIQGEREGASTKDGNARNKKREECGAQR